MRTAECPDTLMPCYQVVGSQNTVAVDREVLRDIAQLLSGSMFTYISTEEQARARGSELYALLAAKDSPTSQTMGLEAAKKLFASLKSPWSLGWDRQTEADDIQRIADALKDSPTSHLGGAEGVEEDGLAAASKALGHEGVYISEATLKRAIAAYNAAFSTAKTEQPDMAQLLKDVIGDVSTFAEMDPEEDESWESWYEAAFEMLKERIRETFERNRVAALSATAKEGE